MKKREKGSWREWPHGPVLELSPVLEHLPHTGGSCQSRRSQPRVLSLLAGTWNGKCGYHTGGQTQSVSLVNPESSGSQRAWYEGKRNQATGEHLFRRSTTVGFKENKRHQCKKTL